jgi:hypothetical protein
MKKYKLKNKYKNILVIIDKILINILQLYLILNINNISINNLYNTLYFNICTILFVIVLELIKINYNKIFN